MIYLGADKHGLEAIRIVSDLLKAEDREFINLGVQEEGEDISLQELIPRVAGEVLKGGGNTGILSCGTEVGVEVGANKLAGIRACLATSAKIAKYSRVYDDCNVLCLVGWEAEKESVRDIVTAWLVADYDGSEKRLKMFDAFNAWGGRV